MAMKTPYTLRDALDAHGPGMVTLARRGYEREGRGAVYLDLETPRHTSDGPAPTHLEYLTPSARLSALADKLDPIHGRNIVSTLVVRYDPEKALVCIARESNGTVYAREITTPL